MEPKFYLLGVAITTALTLITTILALRAKAKERARLAREKWTVARDMAQRETILAEVGLGKSDTASTKIELKQGTDSTAISF